MKSDIEIALSATMRPIGEIAENLGIAVDDLELYGKYKAKIPLSYSHNAPKGKGFLILVSAISPTPAGEGKTTVSIGLSQALNRAGQRSCVVLREPSLGPVFGIKGGATGGGYSQVLPMEDINLHFTGDFGAIEKANNLLSAIIDNNIQSKKSSLGIDPRTISWRRVMDVNDRSLRNIVAGLGGTTSGVPRETGFDITAASEVMAIICLATDIENLKERLGNIFIGYTYDKKPIFARDLKAQGAMATLLKDAIKPNLVQTIENTPAIIHGGPFANIAQGTNSLIATRTSLALTDYTVTEAGFGFDLGAEKFLDIKCRVGNLSPNAVVLVATVRALKYHGGQNLKELAEPSVAALAKGVENLQKHIENIQLFSLEPIVAINKFATDSDEELQFLKDYCDRHNVKCSIADVWGSGGAGALELAQMVVETACGCCENFKPLYKLEDSVEDKIYQIASKIYGSYAVDYTAKARGKLARIKDLGLENLPICIAKTQKSLSDNPNLLGRPKDFLITVRDIEIASGAGFLIPITGDIMRMPGLPDIPSSEHIDIDSNGKISGLF